MKKKLLYFIALFVVIATITVISCSKNSSGYGSSSGTGNPPPTANTVSIYNMAFSTNLSVTAGTTVTWKNNDAMAHTVTADDGSFDSGNIPAGGSYSLKFSDKGTFAYHCTIHPGMKASVTVK